MEPQKTHRIADVKLLQEFKYPDSYICVILVLSTERSTTEVRTMPPLIPIGYVYRWSRDGKTIMAYI